MKLLLLIPFFFCGAAMAHLDTELHHHVSDELPQIEVIEETQESDS